MYVSLKIYSHLFLFRCRTCPADCQDCLAEKSQENKNVIGGGDDAAIQTNSEADSRSNSGSPASSR